jgi:hypothetical protein
MSNEWKDAVVNDIIELGDWELINEVNHALKDTDIELAYELPLSIREALQTIVYDIRVLGSHLTSTMSVEEFNKKEGVEILRKKWKGV